MLDPHHLITIYSGIVGQYLLVLEADGILLIPQFPFNPSNLNSEPCAWVNILGYAVPADGA